MDRYRSLGPLAGWGAFFTNACYTPFRFRSTRNAKPAEVIAHAVRAPYLQLEAQRRT